MLIGYLCYRYFYKRKCQSERILFFFYGSLRVGRTNYKFLMDHLQSAKLVEKGHTIDSSFVMFGFTSKAYPFVVPVTDKTKDLLSNFPPTVIMGEIFNIDIMDKEGMKALEKLEEGYTKKHINVMLDSGKIVNAISYMLDDELHIKEIVNNIPNTYFYVSSGDWNKAGGK